MRGRFGMGVDVEEEDGVVLGRGLWSAGGTAGGVVTGGTSDSDCEGVFLRVIGVDGFAEARAG